MRIPGIPIALAALAAAACGSRPAIPFPKEAAVTPPVARALETATFSLG